MRAPLTTSSAASSKVSECVIEAIDTLDAARVEAMITIRLLEFEIRPNPAPGGLTYPLTSEQTDRIFHAIHLTLASIDRARDLLESEA